MYVNSWRGDAKKEEPGSFECAQRQDQRQWAQNKTGGSVQASERPLLCEGDQALPQVAMRSGEFSLLVDIQKPPGHRSEQLALGGPA